MADGGRGMVMYYLGIDIGSLSCDAVLIDENERILASSVVLTGAHNLQAVDRAVAQVLEPVGLSKKALTAIVATGYGRKRVEDRLAAVTEITCHARGIRAISKDIRVLIDIGGQDSKAILLDAQGNVVDFAMNDKCAAGTGRFLEAMARTLQVEIEQLAKLDHGATGNFTLSSVCTVFAESEVVSLIADGVELREIVSGLNRAIAARTVSLVRRIEKNAHRLPVAMSGGVAKNGGVIRALSATLGCQIFVPDKPDTIGALGAALIARERAKRHIEKKAIML
jgi:predicted CoA-substrate-specific enzyme activase